MEVKTQKPERLTSKALGSWHLSCILAREVCRLQIKCCRLEIVVVSRVRGEVILHLKIYSRHSLQPGGVFLRSRASKLQIHFKTRHGVFLRSNMNIIKVSQRWCSVCNCHFSFVLRYWSMTLMKKGLCSAKLHLTLAITLDLPEQCSTHPPEGENVLFMFNVV